MSRLAKVALALTALAAYLAQASLFIVGEGERALVVRLGAPVRTENTPGLKMKAPFLDTALIYDARLLLLEPPAEQVILGDQKRIEVQTYTRFRIVDPQQFNQSLRTVEQARAQLAQVVSSALRREFGQINLHALLSADRSRVIENVQREVTEKFRPYGVDVVEVRLHRADLPFETSQAIYDRMKSERQREAKELRAQGFEWAQQIQARADRERTVILSEAQRAARIAHGEADAAANKVLGEAVGRDPGFYTFYRSLQTYRQSLADSAPTLVLSPDAEFLKTFKHGPQIAAPQGAR
ncbi:membrane protease subunit HflC [Rhodoblastus acidophilus]|uniref:protease modulator HflC n=1 Tax=Rhodoblastus acidophilus TaxID=1074 RepID=UPI002225532B|nr:protease modulator HflC [Rhodoblastus acidophilus]MCW2285174.1 membrane protease subunit HflC [Rhodoblastus acidophilus]MCW2334130.1 membrane protease subunit HflC [Rhodoblastus acidophilus]